MPRQRKVARTSRLVPEGEQVAPQQVCMHVAHGQLDREDMTESENETSRLVLAIARRLEECSGENGVPLFPFALNPHSFSDSVENLFYISFLIRDGKAAIIDEEDSDPMLCMWPYDLHSTLGGAHRRRPPSGPNTPPDCFRVGYAALA